MGLIFFPAFPAFSYSIHPAAIRSVLKCEFTSEPKILVLQLRKLSGVSLSSSSPLRHVRGIGALVSPLTVTSEGENFPLSTPDFSFLRNRDITTREAEPSFLYSSFPLRHIGGTGALVYPLTVTSAGGNFSFFTARNQLPGKLGEIFTRRQGVTQLPEILLQYPTHLVTPCIHQPYDVLKNYVYLLP